jgi:hypothetical protein
MSKKPKISEFIAVMKNKKIYRVLGYSAKGARRMVQRELGAVHGVYLSSRFTKRVELSL